MITQVWSNYSNCIIDFITKKYFYAILPVINVGLQFILFIIPLIISLPSDQTISSNLETLETIQTNMKEILQDNSQLGGNKCHQY